MNQEELNTHTQTRRVIDLIDSLINLFEARTGDSFEATYPDLAASLDKALDTRDLNDLYYVQENLELITANFETPYDEHCDWVTQCFKEND